MVNEIEGHRVQDLVAQYGSPLFVYSEKMIKQRHRELTLSFTRKYPRFRHAWSYKTNYLKAICLSYHRLGSWAEVVSSMEYEMARQLGVSPEQIIFNGPHKPYLALKRAIQEGALVNIDSFDELIDIEKISGELGTKARVGLRFNMSLGACMSWDRYGFNLESGEALNIVRRAVAGGGVEIVSFHAHIGTFVTDAQRYRVATTKLTEFAKLVRSEFGVRIEILDLGGGFPSKNRLKSKYLSSADTALEFDEYADAICEPILKVFTQDELPLLILESGRTMIDEAGSLISSVVAVKPMNNGVRGLVIDSGVNLLFTAFWYDHEIHPVRDRGNSVEDYTIFGNMCMQIDVIRDRVRLPQLNKGDRIVIHPVGAYNNTQWMQFIALRPNVIFLGESGEI
ncbi:diaminopimelate decarboxylase, partial [bacterium]|nr:diaminopimelate decarboxylase [bacterium]